MTTENILSKEPILAKDWELTESAYQWREEEPSREILRWVLEAQDHPDKTLWVIYQDGLRLDLNIDDNRTILVLSRVDEEPVEDYIYFLVHWPYPVFALPYLIEPYFKHDPDEDYQCLQGNWKTKFIKTSLMD